MNKHMDLVRFRKRRTEERENGGTSVEHDWNRDGPLYDSSHRLVERRDTVRPETECASVFRMLIRFLLACWLFYRLYFSGATHKRIHAFVQSLLVTMHYNAPLDENGIPLSMKGYKWTAGPLRPKYPLSRTREVPSHIPRPDYADHPQGVSQIEQETYHKVKNLNDQEIEGMRKVCIMGREVLDHTAAHIRPGITTDELDRICHEAIIAKDSYPSTLNYRGFPKSLCISVNEVICHGIPDQTVLQKGDIVNLDISLYHGGFHADLNATYPVGHIDEESKKLIKATKQALDEAMAICKPGTLYRDIGNKIESIVGPKGFSIVRQYTGHGTDQRFHGKPLIAHYGGSKTPGKMEVGHCFTIEPMINAGGAACDHWNDSWTAVTKDGSRSAPVRRHGVDNQRRMRDSDETWFDIWTQVFVNRL